LILSSATDTHGTEQVRENRRATGRATLAYVDETRRRRGGRRDGGAGRRDAKLFVPAVFAYLAVGTWETLGTHTPVQSCSTAIAAGLFLEVVAAGWSATTVARGGQALALTGTGGYAYLLLGVFLQRARR